MNRAQKIIESLIISEGLKPVDKKVVDDFYSEKENHKGKLLDTDGKTLEKMGLGRQQIAKWENDKIVITAKQDVKSTESILTYMRKLIPKNNFA